MAWLKCKRWETNCRQQPSLTAPLLGARLGGMTGALYRAPEAAEGVGREGLGKSHYVSFYTGRHVSLVWRRFAFQPSKYLPISLLNAPQEPADAPLQLPPTAPFKFPETTSFGFLVAMACCPFACGRLQLQVSRVQESLGHLSVTNPTERLNQFVLRTCYPLGDIPPVGHRDNFHVMRSRCSQQRLDSARVFKWKLQYQRCRTSPDVRFLVLQGGD